MFSLILSLLLMVAAISYTFIGSEIYTGFSTILISFLFVLAITSTTFTNFRTDSIKKNRGRKRILLLFLDVCFLAVVIIIQTFISVSILLFAVLLILLLELNDNKIHRHNCIKAFVFRCIGVLMLLLGTVLHHINDSSSAGAYIYIVGLFFIIPLFPVSTFLSDLTSRQSLHSGIASIALQFVGWFLLINHASQNLTLIASGVNVFVVLALLSILIVALAGSAQITIFRQFSYIHVFFSSLVVALLFMLIKSAEAVIAIKYLTLSIPLILSLFWISIYPLKSLNTQGMLNNLTGALRVNKKLTLIVFVTMFFTFGTPFTPIFNGIVNSSAALFEANSEFSVFSISISASVVLIIVLIAFLLIIYQVSETFMKLTKKDVTQEYTSNKINISRNYLFIAISLLILILVLSILPVFVFQKLRSDVQKDVNFSEAMLMQSAENNSSEGINEY